MSYLGFDGNSAKDGQQILADAAVATLTGVSGATVTFTNVIPAGFYAFFVQVEVVDPTGNQQGLGVTNGTTGYAVGDGTDPNLWGDVVGTAVGTSNTPASITANPATAAGSVFPGARSAASVVVTAAGGNFDGTGRLRCTVHGFRIVT